MVNYLVAFVVLAIMGFVSLPSLLMKNYRITLAAGETPITRQVVGECGNDMAGGKKSGVPDAVVKPDSDIRKKFGKQENRMGDRQRLYGADAMLTRAQGLHSGEWDYKPLFLIKY